MFGFGMDGMEPTLLLGKKSLINSSIELPYLVISMKTNMPKKEAIINAAKTLATLPTVLTVCIS